MALACVAGFSFSGWSVQRGLFRESGPLAFPLPEFRLLEAEGAGAAQSSLEDLLLAAGEPGALELLSIVERFDSEENRGRIRQWLEQRARSDDGESDRVLGLFAASRGGMSGEALAHFREGAKKGDLESQFRYAFLQWSDGNRLAEGDTLAFLESAASRGHAAAGELLARVRLSLNDPDSGFKWAESAARQGRAPAVHLLGLFYLNGTGCGIDPSEGVGHLRSAAGMGDERAMYDYARCLSEGHGVEASFIEARRWMRIASARGHRAARRWCLDRGIEAGGGTGP